MEDREQRVLDSQHNEEDSDATACISSDSDDPNHILYRADRAAPDSKRAARWSSRYQCPYKAPPPPPPGLGTTPKAMACKPSDRSQIEAVARHNALIRAACATPPEDSSDSDAAEMRRVCEHVRSPTYEEAHASEHDMSSMSSTEPHVHLCCICNTPQPAMQSCDVCDRLSCADTCTATLNIHGSPTRHYCRHCLRRVLSER